MFLGWLFLLLNHIWQKIWFILTLSVLKNSIPLIFWLFPYMVKRPSYRLRLTKKQKFRCSNHGLSKFIFALRLFFRDFLMCVCHRWADVMCRSFSERFLRTEYDVPGWVSRKKISLSQSCFFHGQRDAGNAEILFASHEAQCRNILKLLSDKLYVKASAKCEAWSVNSRLTNHALCRWQAQKCSPPRSSKGGSSSSHLLNTWGQRVRK